MVTDDMLASPALPLLLQLEAAGVHFRLDGDRVLVSPPGTLTPEQRQVFRQHQDAVRVLVTIATDEGIQARRDTFRQQIEAASPGTLPAFLFRPEVPYTRGRCFSCGDALPELRFLRCSRCSVGWRLACRLPIPNELAAAIDAARVV